MISSANIWKALTFDASSVIEVETGVYCVRAVSSGGWSSSRTLEHAALTSDTTSSRFVYIPAAAREMMVVLSESKPDFLLLGSGSAEGCRTGNCRLRIEVDVSWLDIVSRQSSYPFAADGIIRK
jgi:hypothetical protein